MENRRLKKRAFTLVEMLVVIGIIAVLAAASMVGYSKVVKSARKSKTQELVSNVATALTQILSKNNGVWPEDLLERVNNGNGRLDAETSRVFVRYDMLGLSYNAETAGSDVSQYRLRKGSLRNRRCGGRGRTEAVRFRVRRLKGAFGAYGEGSHTLFRDRHGWRRIHRGER